MASLLYKIKDNFDDWRIGKHAEVDTWFLMSSPAPILLITVCYLLFVLKLGPFLMRDRKPMELRRTMVWYNGIQVVWSIFLVYKCLTIEYPLETITSVVCNPKNQATKNNVLLLGGAWYYFFAKVTELLDTVFFVLRKRSSQISFLHVYHHSVTMLFSWCFLKYAPDGQGMVVGLVNSLVHIVMYSYYMLAAMGPAYRKYLWWKKYMTVMQLVQFLIIIAYMSTMAFFNCGLSKSVSYFFMVNALIFLYLFTDFYRKAYKSGKEGRTDINKKTDLNANTEVIGNGLKHHYAVDNNTMTSDSIKSNKYE